MDFSHDSDLQETIEKITRVLMLIDGKLIDNLSPADDRIRAWVKHFADSVGRSAERLDHLEQVRKISDATPDEADRAVAGLLAGFMSVDADAYNTRVAAGLLEQHYLDENPL
jgi:alkanesulfonate monooxygenase SsuD/methylene tetrahydromethanopterin reductase-like flavin-dependent oxidoreductase (luciferase family)